MIKQNNNSKSSSYIRCPVCGASASLFDKIFDGSGTLVDILHCSSCTALINVGAYDLLMKSPIEELQDNTFYELSYDELSCAKREIDNADGLLQVLRNHVVNLDLKVFCDFGAGRGYVAIKAAEYFRRSIACEMHSNVVRQIIDVLSNPPGNLDIISEPEQAEHKIDVLFMWHVLERLPHPTKFWRSRSHLLSDDAVIFLQIPLFRPNHVVHSHYVFYNEKCLSYWSRQIGAEPIWFGYDVENSFLSMIARRDHASKVRVSLFSRLRRFLDKEDSLF